jgi:hypothetical protein
MIGLNITQAFTEFTETYKNKIIANIEVIKGHKNYNKLTEDTKTKIDNYEKSIQTEITNIGLQIAVIDKTKLKRDELDLIIKGIREINDEYLEIIKEISLKKKKGIKIGQQNNALNNIFKEVNGRLLTIGQDLSQLDALNEKLDELRSELASKGRAGGSYSYSKKFKNIGSNSQSVLSPVFKDSNLFIDVKKGKGISANRAPRHNLINLEPVLTYKPDKIFNPMKPTPKKVKGGSIGDFFVDVIKQSNILKPKEIKKIESLKDKTKSNIIGTLTDKIQKKIVDTLLNKISGGNIDLDELEKTTGIVYKPPTRLSQYCVKKGKEMASHMTRAVMRNPDLNLSELEEEIKRNFLK